MIIDSKPETIGALLEGKYFRVPRYQRPYSWEKAHLEDFWRDAIQTRKDEDYFIGSIVTAKPRKEHAYSIVDGQQRLTTITVLLCVLRNAFDTEGFTDLAEGTHTLIERRNRENKSQYILTTESSYPFLQEHIQKRGPAELDGGAGPEEEALQVARDFFVEKIAEVTRSIRADSSKDDERKKAKVGKTLKAIRDQVLSLQVISVELENEDDAYLVFETLNTRGKDLRVSDLVKNLLLRLKPTTNLGVDVAKDKWNKLLDILEDSDASIKVDAFLHHAWLSRYDFVAQKKLFMTMKDVVTRSTVDHFLNDLLRDAYVYRVVHEPDFRDSKWIQQEHPIRNSLVAIDQFGIRLSVPVILALMRDWEDGAITLPMVRNSLHALV